MATYSVRGLSSTQRLRGRIGNLGRIAVRFEPTGRVDRIEPPRGCEGRDAVVTHGVFVGTIRFRGEGGYTRVDAHRAKGRVTTSPSWRCGSVPSIADLEKRPVEFSVLAASAPHQRVFFAATKTEEDLDLASFRGGTIESRGALRIERQALADEREGTFDFEPGLGAASVEPPAPFRGTASFVREPDGLTSWSGPLSVVLPGAGVVQLTGPTFSADLAQPKTLGEYLDMLGLEARLRG